MNPEQQKDDQLWQIAKARVGFKWSLLSYLVVNAMLIVIWFLSSGADSYFWPVWPLMGWGVGLAFQYFSAYHGNNFINAANEYEKLRRNQP